MEPAKTAAGLRARDSLPGTVIADRYHVDELLAEGGMGCVFRAFDEQQECFVAIKVLKASAAKDDALRSRFLKEAHTTRSIRSEHVVSITDVGELDDGSAFYAMEFLDGVTLDELRVDTFEDVRTIALQLCSGLAAAHQRGIVHRDLKPENIIVDTTEDGAPHCRLIDFGIAKLPHHTMMTLPGQVLGTPDYIAPEQVKATRSVDHRCDVYALGVVLYELVTGTLPFEDDDPIRVALAHIAAPPRPVSELEPSCPAALADLIMRCLAKEPDERPGSMIEVAAAIRSVELRGLIGDSHTVPIGATGSSGELARREGTTRIHRGSDSSSKRRHRTPSPRAMRLTPPGPEPWLRPCHDTGASAPFALQEPERLLRIVLGATLALTAVAVTISSMM